MLTKLESIERAEHEITKPRGRDADYSELVKQAQKLVALKSSFELFAALNLKTHSSATSTKQNDLKPDFNNNSHDTNENKINLVSTNYNQHCQIKLIL